MSINFSALVFCCINNEVLKIKRLRHILLNHCFSFKIAMEDSSPHTLPKREAGAMTFSSWHNHCKGYLVCVMHTEVENGQAGAEAGR